MKGRFLKHKQNYYRRINHLMNRINLELNIEKESTPESDLNIINKDKNKEKDKNKKNIQKCTICNENEVKYICPKCKVAYCNMDCYKKHNKDCTEEFYKNNVVQELKSMKFSEEETKQFKKKYKDYQEKLNSIDEQYEQVKNEEEGNKIKNKEIEHYEEILDKMNNDKFNAKFDFTADDWKNFHEFMKTFQNSEMFKIYKPYWTREPKSLLVFDKTYFESLSEEEINNLKNLDINSFYKYINVNEDSENENNNEDKEFDLDISDEKNYIVLKGEKILIDENVVNDSIIIKYEKLTKLNFQKANEKNIYQIINIIILNVYIYRLFNGIVDDDDNLKDVYNHIIYLCPLLYNKKIKIPDNVEEAYNSFLEKLKRLENNKENFDKVVKLLLNDIINLLKGDKFFIYESLVRLYDIIHKYSIKIDIEEKDKGKCTASKYKLIYFMSYLKYQVKENNIHDILDTFMHLNE